MAASQTYDVVIVGGAIVGSAIAYFLARESQGRLRVLVVERDPTYAHASTSLSLSSIRVQFSRPENIAISRFGVAFLKSLGDWLEVDGDTPDVGFKERGYLLLASEAGLEALRANQEIQRAAGCDVALLDPREIERRFPWMRSDGLAAGTLGMREEGWFDAYALMQAFRRKARALGVSYREDEVVELSCEGGRISGVQLASGGRLSAETVVNAAGPAARRVAAMAGVELPVFPRKRSVFVFDCKADLPECPLIVDPSGVYVRPEGDGFICGSSPGPGDLDPDCEDFDVEWDAFESFVWPTLAARIPAFEAIKLTGGWAGHYAVNPEDHNAILGRHPRLSNFLLANGFSGHGVQQSPAVGRGIAELIVHGEYRSLDLSAFDFERFAEDRRIREFNVI
jgi:sarcosine oxidase